jgi:F-type H+-transporting ATPase subunit a
MNFLEAGWSGLGALPLAAANPLDHVLDGHLVFDHSGSLAEIGITKQTFLFFLAGVFTLLFFWSYFVLPKLLRLLFFWRYSGKAGNGPVPSRWGNFVEFILEFLRDQLVRPFMGPHGDKYVPFLATFFVYILFCNLMGLIPFFDYLGHGGNTATGNLGITAAMAICAFVGYHVLGIREQGFGHYVKNLFPPVPIFVKPVIIVVELAAHCVRPCALAIRLFANMLAGHTLVAAILGFTIVFTKDFLVPGAAISLVSLVGVTALTFLELLIALVQAFVFTFLTTVYIAGAVHPEH